MDYEKHLQQFENAVTRLHEALLQPKNEFIRDSAIQRFEFCVDLSWKTLKRFLKDESGIICTSPKNCFKEAYSASILDYDDYYLKLIDLRNLTSHTYHEPLAEKIFAELPKAEKAFQKLITILKQ